MIDWINIDWINVGLVLAQGALLGLVFYGMVRTERLKNIIAADMEEIGRRNSEFAETLLLAQYGATEEAVEMAKRWEQRA